MDKTSATPLKIQIYIKYDFPRSKEGFIPIRVSLHVCELISIETHIQYTILQHSGSTGAVKCF